jgi:hypothetical protein
MIEPEWHSIRLTEFRQELMHVFYEGMFASISVRRRLALPFACLMLQKFSSESSYRKPRTGSRLTVYCLPVGVEKQQRHIHEWYRMRPS